MRGLGMLIGVLFVTLLLRSTALTGLASHGVVLDVLAFATVLWAMRRGAGWGATFGFALGLAADLDAAYWLGRHALILSLIGYGIGRLSHTVVRESPRTQAVLLMIATVLHQGWVAIFDLGGPAGWPYLLERVLLAVIATVPAGTLVLLAARRLLGRALFGNASTEPQT